MKSDQPSAVELGAVLLLLDPLMSRLSDRLDTHRDGLPELDVAPVEELSGCDFVLEVGSAGGTLKAAGAAALNDWVLATSVDL
jgi:hypothetical protein